MTDPTGWADYLDPGADTPYAEDLSQGGAWLLDLVAVVDFLRRGDRKGLTVWDAVAEAAKWWADERVSTIEGIPDPELTDLPGDDPESLHRALGHLLDAALTYPPVTADVALQQAVRRWVEAISARHNDGDPWPRRTTPSG